MSGDGLVQTMRDAPALQRLSSPSALRLQRFGETPSALHRDRPTRDVPRLPAMIGVLAFHASASSPFCALLKEISARLERIGYMAENAAAVKRRNAAAS